MLKSYYREYSEHLDREMDFIVYGEKGIPILVFPAQNGHCQDYENFGMVDTIKDKIEKGQVQLFCIGCIDEEHYSDQTSPKSKRSEMLEKYYYYVCDEIVPRIQNINGKNHLIYTTGCSMGATHAANMMLRRPDLFMGTIALSGYYDTDIFFGNYVDENIFHNSPLKYLNGMQSDHPYLGLYTQRKIILCTGQGAWEDEMIKSTRLMKATFDRLGVNAWADFWGYDVNHDWDWWRKQLPYFLDHI